MDCALIVAAKESEKDSLFALMEPFPIKNVVYAHNSKEAKNMIASTSFALIIINAPLAKESAQELALFMTQRTTAAVILLLPESSKTDSSYDGEDYGILTLFKPFKRSEFNRTIKFAIAFENRMASMHTANQKLEKKLSEVQTIHRAKCLLIQHLNMTEAQAHRYLEKHAMDRRESKVEVAATILNTYDNN